MRAVLLPPLAALLALTPLHAQQTRDPDEEARYRSTVLFANVLELIRDEYVDTSKTDYDRLTYAALRGMLNSLDPHSQFMDPQAFSEMRSETEGSFGGLGISLGMSEGFLTVHVPVEGGPAFRAGVVPGDRIIKIDGQNTDRMTLSEAVKKLRGEPGQPVNLLLFRPDTRVFREIVITRELINVPSVRDAVLLPGPEKLGYLRITQFGEKTTDEFEKALKTLQGQGMTGLILDLRNNPGGLLEAAVEVAGKFLPQGTVVVSTEGRYGGRDRILYQARTRHRVLDLPLVVLINGNSASGSEIVAGALKDLRRAVLLGETTFGKGSVQTVQPVDRTITPPAALRLTTARYYTPSRRMIHEVGVAPDIFAPIPRSLERDLFMKRSLTLLSPEERRRVESLEDPQLARAIDTLKGLQLFRQRLARTTTP